MGGEESGVTKLDRMRIERATGTSKAGEIFNRAWLTGKLTSVVRTCDEKEGKKHELAEKEYWAKRRKTELFGSD